MKLEELYKLREQALWHIVGTSYWTQVVLELNKKIEEEKEKEKKCQMILKKN